MKSFIVVVAFWITQAAGAEGLRLFNPGVFGVSVNSSVRLLLDEPVGIEPSLIQVDLKDGKFYAATVRYKTRMSLSQARQSLNRLYARWQRPSFAEDPNMGLWREEEKGFSIQLTKDDDEIVVIYISRRELRSSTTQKNVKGP